MAMVLANAGIIPVSSTLYDEIVRGIIMLFCFVGAKLLKFDLEDAIIASNANIGGPTTAAGMAISQGWHDLVGPAMPVGTLGYVLGITWRLLLPSRRDCKRRADAHLEFTQGTFSAWTSVKGEK